MHGLAGRMRAQRVAHRVTIAKAQRSVNIRIVIHGRVVHQADEIAEHAGHHAVYVGARGFRVGAAFQRQPVQSGDHLAAERDVPRFVDVVLVVDLLEDVGDAFGSADLMVVVVDELLEDQRAGEHVQVLQLGAVRLLRSLQLDRRIDLARVVQAGLGEVPHVEVLFAHEDVQVLGHVGIARLVDATADEAQHALDAVHVEAEEIDRLPFAQAHPLAGVQLVLVGRAVGGQQILAAPGLVLWNALGPGETLVGVVRAPLGQRHEAADSGVVDIHGMTLPASSARGRSARSRPPSSGRPR